MANCKCNGKACKCWLLGYAKTFVACSASGTMLPLFKEPAILGGGGPGGMPPNMPRLNCPSGADQQCCDETYDEFAALYAACQDNECRVQVYLAYSAALGAC